MEAALKKAIKEGWAPKIHREAGKVAEDAWRRQQEADWSKMYYYKAEVLLDPLFWQSLGKALGWVNGDVQIKKVKDHGVGHNPRYTAETHTERRESYLFHWHRFIDHLAEGKDADSFFNDLLKAHS